MAFRGGYILFLKKDRLVLLGTRVLSVVVIMIASQAAARGLNNKVDVMKGRDYGPGGILKVPCWNFTLTDYQRKNVGIRYDTTKEVNYI